MLQLFRIIVSSRFCWFLLFVSGIALEACGLYFQYQLKLQPCVDCVYERAYFMVFVIAGFLGALAGNYFIVRFVCALGFLLSCVGGFIVSLSHYQAYTSTGLGAKCKMIASFPDFMPLDSWFPWMFKPFGLCSDKLDWQFFGQSMPFYILLIFTVAGIIAFLMLLGIFVKKKGDNFVKLYK